VFLMKTIAKGFLILALVATPFLAMTTPAQAQVAVVIGGGGYHHHHHWHHHHWHHY